MSKSGQGIWSSAWAIAGVAVTTVVVLVGVLLAAWTPFILVLPLLAIGLVVLAGTFWAGDDDAPEGRVERRWDGAYADPQGRHAVRTEGMISDRHRGV